MTDTMTAAIGAVGTAVGVIGTRLIDRYRNRDKLNADQAGAMISKLWDQNKELTAKVDECQRNHQECEKQNARLEEKVSGLREDLDDLRQRMECRGLME